MIRAKISANNVWSIGYLSGYGQGELRRGRLESWPFINSFASLLGGKEWSGWGRADFRMAGGGMRLDQRVGAWRIGTDTRLLRVWSGLFATTRERKKLDFSTLFFPRTYREEGDIQADALDLRIRLEYRLSRWGVRYGFAQIVPLRVKSSFELGDGEREGSGGREHRLVLFFLSVAVAYSEELIEKLAALVPPPVMSDIPAWEEYTPVYPFDSQALDAEWNAWWDRAWRPYLGDIRVEETVDDVRVFVAEPADISGWGEGGA